MLKKQLEIKKKKQLGIEKQIPTGPVVTTHASTARAGVWAPVGKLKIPHAAEPKNKFKKKWKN